MGARSSFLRDLLLLIPVLFASGLGTAQVAALPSIRSVPVDGTLVTFTPPRPFGFSLPSVPEACNTGGGGVKPLALRITRLEARRRDAGRVDLFWELESSDEPLRWTLERRLDAAVAFTAIQVLTDEQVRSRTYTDPNAHPGTSYYRMRGQTPDGFTEFTPIRSVPNTFPAPGPRVFPNPAGGGQPVTLLLPPAGFDFELRVLDGYGRAILRRTYPAGGERSIPLSTAGLPPGVYVIQRVAANGNTLISRLVIGN